MSTNANKNAEAFARDLRSLQDAMEENGVDPAVIESAVSDFAFFTLSRSIRQAYIEDLLRLFKEFMDQLANDMVFQQLARMMQQGKE